MYGSRTPTVGALGDAGAVTEIYPKSESLLALPMTNRVSVVFKQIERLGVCA